MAQYLKTHLLILTDTCRTYLPDHPAFIDIDEHLPPLHEHTRSFCCKRRSLSMPWLMRSWFIMISLSMQFINFIWRQRYSYSVSWNTPVSSLEYGSDQLVTTHPGSCCWRTNGWRLQWVPHFRINCLNGCACWL